MKQTAAVAAAKRKVANEAKAAKRREELLSVIHAGGTETRKAAE